MNSSDLNELASQYKWDLESLIDRRELPHTWFEHPDYFAIKTYTKDAYTETVNEFLPNPQDVIAEWKGNRRITTIRLLGHQAVNMAMGFHNFPKPVEWLRITEGYPDAEFTQPAVLDHLGIHFPRSLGAIRTVLGRRGIDFFDGFEGYGPHRSQWLSLIINNKIPGDELRFTEEPLKKIIEEKFPQSVAEQQ